MIFILKLGPDDVIAACSFVLQKPPLQSWVSWQRQPLWSLVWWELQRSWLLWLCTAIKRTEISQLGLKSCKYIDNQSSWKEAVVDAMTAHCNSMNGSTSHCRVKFKMVWIYLQFLRWFPVSIHGFLVLVENVEFKSDNRNNCGVN